MASVCVRFNGLAWTWTLLRRCHGTQHKRCHLASKAFAMFMLNSERSNVVIRDVVGQQT